MDGNPTNEVEIEPSQPSPQPKGRLRIINQGPMTENIHDLKSANHNHEQNQQNPNLESTPNNFINWLPNSNNLLALDQPPCNLENMENSLWYNQFNYNEEGSTWTTPASTASTSTSWPTESSSTSQTWTTTATITNPNEPGPSNGLEIDKSTSTVKAKDFANSKKSEDEVKLRPPPPLARAKNVSTSKRPELEVRKDLTLPTAPTAREDNVFQAEEDLPIVFDIDNEDLNDVVENPATNEQSEEESNRVFKCKKCSMIFNSDAQLRSHSR